MKTEYLIMGSNNFWYASCLTSLAQVKAEIRKIKTEKKWYADEETGHQPETPETLYVYRANEVKRINL